MSMVSLSGAGVRSVTTTIDTTGEPGRLAVGPDGTRLYVGAGNSPLLTVVELDGDRLPVSSFQIALDGDIERVGCELNRACFRGHILCC